MDSSALKRWVAISLGVLALLAILVTIGFFLRHAVRQSAHNRVLERAMVVIHRNDQSPPPGETTQTWHNYLGAPHNAMSNFFAIPAQFPTEKMEAMVAQFESNWPEGLKSVADVLRMNEEIQRYNPKTIDYEPFVTDCQWAREAPTNSR